MKSVSLKYRTISTDEINAQLRGVLAQRQLVEASVQDTALPSYTTKIKRGSGTRHSVVYTLHGLKTSVNGDDITPTIHLFNSYQGESAFMITVGFLRQVCSNGMVVGTAFFTRRIVHRVGDTTERKLAEVATGIAAALDYIASKFTADMGSLANTALTPERMVSVARVLKLSDRRRDNLIARINGYRRPADTANNLWTLWNLANEAARAGSRSELRQDVLNANLLADITNAYVDTAA